MLKNFENVAALFLSLLILLTGHGLQLTLVPLYAASLGFSPVLIGYIGSAYFLGFVLGCLLIPRLIASVGHIRVFLVLASTATAALLLLSVLEHPLFWILLRLFTGWAMAGLYMVFESWLNTNATEDNRGMILSVYVLLTLVAIGLGQLLIGLDLGFADFITWGAVLLALGAVPVGVTRSEAPAPVALTGINLGRVFRVSQVAVLGALVAGFVTSGFWALGPLVATSQGVPLERVGIFMALTITGGAAAQLPVGRLSDRLDRRLVILLLFVLAVLLCGAAVLLTPRLPQAIYPVMFLFGATTFPLYSICLAHANDNTGLNLLEIGSAILLMQSVGAVLGPLVIATVIASVDAGFFMATGLVMAVFTLWLAPRIILHRVHRPYFEPFTELPGTTQEAFELSQPEPVEQAEATHSTVTEKATSPETTSAEKH